MHETEAGVVDRVGSSVKLGLRAQVAPENTTFALRPPELAEIMFDPGRYAAIVPFGGTNVELVAGLKPVSQARLRAGGVTFSPPNGVLRLHPLEPVEILVLSIAPDRIRTLAALWSQERPWYAETVVDFLDPGVAALGQELRRSLLADDFSQPAYRQALGDALVTRMLCHFLGELDEDARGETLSPGRLARIVRHIDARLDGSLRVSDLAEMAGLSRSHFSRAFQQATGDPPQRFILKRRVCRARDLLSSDGPSIAQVAVRAGFSSQAHLSTAFKHEVGTTPGLYRAAFRKDA
jgi:AraC family transcriptional regulator